MMSGTATAHGEKKFAMRTVLAASAGYQLAAPIGGGLIPVVAAAIVGRNHGTTRPVSALMIALAVITMLAVLYARETAPAVAESRGGLQKAEALRALTSR